MFHPSNPLAPPAPHCIVMGIFYLPTYDPAAYSTPDPAEVGKVFRCSWLSAIIASCVFPVVVFGLWPGLCSILPTFNLTAFKVWIGVIVFYLLCSTIGCMVLPLLGYLNVFGNCYRAKETEELIPMTSDLPTIEYFVSSDSQEQQVEENEGHEGHEVGIGDDNVGESEDKMRTSEENDKKVDQIVDGNKQTKSAALLEVNA
ncbi:unnamed protein product [Dibothriocephalus latus]|uniref:Uncharacterized protein n=1 Tax=Dibothriocephalus latus TaxID=60516 RepID=A0A3P6TY74_DIBLA|nr:unnamed protein product [Dibothriocephalus latus]